MLKDIHQRILINLKLLEQQGKKKCTPGCIIKKNYHSHVDPWPSEGIDCEIIELKNVGLIENSTNAELCLTAQGTQQATHAFEKFLAKTMIQSITSETLHRFREDFYGTDLYQYNITTRNQFAALKNLILPSPQKSLLDLGCGLGGTAQYFAGFGAKVHAVDLVSDLIEHNKNRLKTFPTLALTFETADISEYIPPENQFDAIYSIDAFQFLTISQLNQTLPRLLNSLKPKGILAVLCSQLVPASADSLKKPQLAAPQELALGKSLESLNIPYTTVDFSDEYIPFWQRCAQVAETLKKEFIQEGFGWFYQERIHESARILKETLSGNSAFGRYLYMIRKS
jgi:2-polyprenyl-3-methyl-5-hydroxy-6-metoxy-1,4-benzoquinol methylase